MATKIVLNNQHLSTPQKQKLKVYATFPSNNDNSINNNNI